MKFIRKQHELEREINGRRYVVTLNPEGRGEISIWFDLLFSGCVLSEQGERAAIALIDAYAGRGNRQRLAVKHTHNLMNYGNSIFFHVLAQDVETVIEQLVALAGNVDNLECRE